MSYISDDDLNVQPENITGKFRDSFESFTNGVNWNLTQGSGDIVQLDGNAVSASYLVISKDPLSTNTVTTLESTASYPVPLEIAAGIHMSQRALGQELSYELVSDEAPLNPVEDIAISSISQSSTTLTVNTSAPHGLVAGKRIGIRGVTSDSRFNYPALVVASTPNATQFTCTAGPAGTIASVTSGPFTNQGYVYFRPAMAYAQNGLSEIFENISTTNASFYARSNAGDSLPSGTYGSNHSLSTASTSSTQAISSAYTYAFLPGSEYRVCLQADRVQWQDAGVDTASAPSSRLLRTQVIPDISKRYKIRFRFTNNKSLPIPNAKIVSAAKSGTTTGTFTTDGDHGLTTGDYINIYGVGDTTNFPNVTTSVQVLSVPTTTSFTATIGSSATATSAGGFVSRAQGSQAIQNVQSTVAAQASSTASLLTLIGSASWSVLVGDYVNVYGLRNRATGADLGFDGAYRVVDIVSSTLVLQPLTGTTLPAPISLTNTGGTVIKRTDMRLSFVRAFEYLRQRVEVQPNGASAASLPVNVVNQISSITPVSTNTFSLVTSTNLTSGATYTSSTLSTYASSTSLTVYPTQLVIGVSHTAGLTPGQLYVDWGTDTSSTTPTTWYTSLAVPIPSNANIQYFTLPVLARYYRLRFVNGATAQTSFRLTTMLTYNGGGLSSQLSFPRNLQYPLSTTALAGNAAFTGPTLDFGDTMNVYQTLTAIAFADQASASNGFKIQISRDGTNWRDTAAVASVTANTLSSISAHISYRYARVVYTNGATLQGSFSLDAHADSE